jgi:hypothetical protein
MSRRKRREFTLSDRIAIRGRASDPQGRVHCERCGAWCRKKADYQIDHVIPEGLRPAADLLRPLKPSDGQLLCLDCHTPKTKTDKGHIGKAVRLEGAHVGVSTPPTRKINWGARKEPKPKLTKIANGKSRIAREYGQ